MINRVSSEALSFSFASVSVLRVNVSSTRLGLPDTAATAGSSTASAASPASGGPDTVTVSPQALAAGQSASPAAVEGTSTSDTGAPAPATTDTTTVPPTAPTAPSASAQKIAALIKALDRNQDGALSEEEFVEGAKALLRGSRGHHHHRAHRHDERGDGAGETPGSEAPAPATNPGRALGLEKRLARAFGRLDGDGSGSLTQEELVAALDRATGGAGSEAPAAPPSPEAPPAPEPLPPSPAPTASAPAGSVNVAYSVTFVSIAVKSYQAVGQLAA